MGSGKHSPKVGKRFKSKKMGGKRRRERGKKKKDREKKDRRRRRRIDRWSHEKAGR